MELWRLSDIIHHGSHCRMGWAKQSEKDFS